MSILIDEKTRVLVQGITGRQGSFHTASMLEYGTKIVAGVTPGKGGEVTQGIQIYDSVGEVPGKIDASIIFVPAKFTKTAVDEAIEKEIKNIIVITEGVPIHDSLKFVNQAKEKNISLVGPNTPGLISCGKSKIGIMPNHIFTPGDVAVISRSGTLTYEIVSELTQAGIGQSTAIGLGGDPIVGLDYIDLLKKLKDDPETKTIVLVGEIGGNAEEKAAQYLMETNYPKPVIAYIVGKSAPPGKKMGHAGAIVSGNSGSYNSKYNALTEAGVHVCSKPAEIVSLIKEKI